MGDPRKPKKKYSTPSHPWQRARIEEEKALAKEYGTKNRVEIWKHKTQLKDYKQQIKTLVASHKPQAKKEMTALIQKLIKLGVLKEGAQTDDILELDIRKIMDRRLQTLVYKKSLSRSMKQARQFIVHEHIMVAGKKITSPSQLIKLDQESTISFSPDSNIAKDDHPERLKPTENNYEAEKKEREEKNEKAKDERKFRRTERSSRPARKPRDAKDDKPAEGHKPEAKA